uniref:Uncharacterized protein n=1 Tax=Magallana gigas TaxID=29159 RepID=A0A8W8JV62_MAGGI
MVFSVRTPRPSGASSRRRFTQDSKPNGEYEELRSVICQQVVYCSDPGCNVQDSGHSIKVNGQAIFETPSPVVPLACVVEKEHRM